RDEIECRRDTQTLRRRRHTHRGVATARHQGADGVTGAPSLNTRASGSNRTGDFETGKITRARWRRIGTATLKNVRTVYARGGDANEHVARPRCRIGTLDQLENLGPSGLANLNAPHITATPKANGATTTTARIPPTASRHSRPSRLVIRRNASPCPCPGCS